MRELKFAISIELIYLGCRTPRGVRELKYARYLCHLDDADSRTPRGVRELKFDQVRDLISDFGVALRVGCVS